MSIRGAKRLGDRMASNHPVGNAGVDDPNPAVIITPSVHQKLICPGWSLEADTGVAIEDQPSETTHTNVAVRTAICEHRIGPETNRDWDSQAHRDHARLTPATIARLAILVVNSKNRIRPGRWQCRNPHPWSHDVADKSIQPGDTGRDYRFNTARKRHGSVQLHRRSHQLQSMTCVTGNFCRVQAKNRKARPVSSGLRKVLSQYLPAKDFLLRSRYEAD